MHLAAGEVEAALERLGSGAQALHAVLREPDQGEPTRLAQGYAYEGPMSGAVEGKPRPWRERRLVGRSMRHAAAAAAALRARGAKAKAPVDALHLRGRGRRRVAEVEP